MKHGMDVIAKATEHVNHGQVPVLTVDQPLSKYVGLMGGIHIQIALLNVLGHW